MKEISIFMKFNLWETAMQWLLRERLRIAVSLLFMTMFTFSKEEAIINDIE